MVKSIEWLSLDAIEQKVCDLASVQLAIRRERISPSDRILEDLQCDSLDLVELLMEIEEEFGVSLPDQAPDPVYKSVWIRRGIRLSDLAELVYLRQETGAKARTVTPTELPPASGVPFTQLGGVWLGGRSESTRLWEPIDEGGPWRVLRRRTDGMRCVEIPGAEVELGNDGPDSLADERPAHSARIDPFLIDAEPVSTTAYCRFLNSVGDPSAAALHDWFVLEPDDDRDAHRLVRRGDSGWQPVPGAERWPMILVSWYGANAYSLWANGEDWSLYRDEELEPASRLPTEAQWEYAARGPRRQTYPWGDALPSAALMRFGRHHRHATYTANTLPMADVNASLGMSPFGLHHMAGNVWQWCRDWYDDAFYSRPESTVPDPWNRTPARARSERGGSWVGPAELCRSSYRRGRPPLARGRCLGFRCVSPVP
ncbi:MAG: SUMF1/EgtB/PvdO family nonheme iron enzyme [Isosphaeraceae bacterium]